jgi:two-component system sensor histidine kinase SenX3
VDTVYGIGLLVAALAVGVAAGLFARTRRSEASAAADRAEGADAIDTEERPSGKRGMKGLGRKSLDSLRVGVVVLDPDDNPVLINPAARAMGLLRSGGAPGTIAAHPILRTLAGQVRRTGVRREVELDLPRGRNGSAQAPLGLHLRAVALNSTHVAIEAADVTESHRLARVRRDFVANVSHELKTPVGALSLLSETIEDAADDPEAVRRFAKRMQHESIRLTNVVQDLITLSRLQGGEPVAEPKVVSLDDVVHDAVDRCRLKAEPKEITLAIGGREGLKVQGEEELLITAVRNFIDNAIAYSPEHTRVVVCTRLADERHAEISVTDQGIGIPEADLQRIFERFYRVDPARSRQTGGTGLGLAIVKHAATRHRGEVNVWSKEGSGSTFTIRLPLLTTSASAKEQIDQATVREAP